MAKIADQPTAQWYGNWGNTEQDIRSLVSRTGGSVPVVVAYNIPHRDCGGWSAGGANDYANWIAGFARGIQDHSAIVILEPDALAGIDCLSPDQQNERYNLLSSAITTLKGAGATVYLDAGHSSWKDVLTMSERLKRAGVAQADGFSLNVSNFNPTANEVAYGQKISDMLGGKHFVIDTSRNGAGSFGYWCNVWQARLGNRPTLSTGVDRVDGYLWIKVPGESDGYCSGGPAAGVFWPDFAYNMARNSN